MALKVPLEEAWASLPLYEFPGWYILLPVTSYTFPCKRVRT